MIADEVDVSKNTAGPKPGLGEQAYTRIKHDIVWCRLRPGEEVSEARLCELYGFGKAPVRQALLRLGQEAYITAQSRRGHVVAPLTLRAVRDLFEWRLIVEPAASLRAAGRVDRARLLELDARCVEGYTPGDVESEAAFITANNAFHQEIARSTGIERLERAFAQIQDEMTRLLHIGYVLRERPDAMKSEHRGLIEALASGDAELANEITVAHIHSVRELVMNGLTQFSSLSEANIAPV